MTTLRQQYIDRWQYIINCIYLDMKIPYNECEGIESRSTDLAFLISQIMDISGSCITEGTYYFLFKDPSSIINKKIFAEWLIYDTIKPHNRVRYQHIYNMLLPFCDLDRVLEFHERLIPLRRSRSA